MSINVRREQQVDLPSKNGRTQQAGKRRTEVIPVLQWIEDNAQFFAPPVCNLLMHKDGQLKVMFVGGPNIRNDFHIEEGEELFYQFEGDMVLRVQERGKFRDIKIKQGEMFILPGKVPHSPQRFANTNGMVLERQRFPNELDCIRYFVPSTDRILWEEWVYCQDLAVDIVPVIKRFEASDSAKLGTPLENLQKPPFQLDTEVCLMKPFNISDFIEDHREEIQRQGSVTACLGCTETSVIIYGKGCHEGEQEPYEILLWQFEGSAVVKIDGTPYTIEKNDTLLIPEGAKYSTERQIGLTVYMFMDWRKKSVPIISNSSATKGHSSVTNGHSSVTNGHSSVTNGHSSVTNGHSSATNGHSSATNGHSSATNGHTGQYFNA